MQADLTIHDDFSLASLNTFRIPARARHYLRVNSAAELEAVRRDPALAGLPRLVLGGGKTSRLYKRLVYKDQLATGASASADGSEIGGQFDMTLTARPGAGVARMERIASPAARPSRS